MRDTSKRREQIVRQLKDQGSVQVLDLVARFDVSGVTIRKDLTFLENEGIAKRSYGGAILNDNGLFDSEVNLDKKETLFAKEKRLIGKAGAELVEDGDSVILDSGSTTMRIAGFMGKKQDLTVITNGLNIANELARFEQINTMLLGGTLRHKNMSFFGNDAQDILADLHVDKVFLGVDGFHMQRGITTHFEPEAILNRLMCKAANEIIVVTDSSKFGHRCLHKILEPKLISAIVTDSGIPDEYREGLNALGIKVNIVETK